MTGPGPVVDPTTQALIDEVTQDVTVMDGADTFITGVTAQLQQAVATATTLATLQAAVTAQVAALNAARTPLGVALAANTPAAATP